jgi:anti-sigma B factor antagonist
MTNNDIVPGFDGEKCARLEIALLRIEGLEGGLMLSLTGSVDNDSWQYFYRHVTRAIEAGFIRLVFDLGGLRFMGGSGFGSFTRVLRFVKQCGGNLALVNLEPKIRENLELLGFSKFFNVRDTLAEAIAVFASAGEPPVYPIVFMCPICSHRVRAAKPGRFRCRACKTILVIDPSGRVSLS